MKVRPIPSKATVIIVFCMFIFFLTGVNAQSQRGRPHLNSARTTFIADNGQLLRGPFTSTEWTSAVPAEEIANMRNLGFNAIHLYAECFDINYPASGSTAPGYAATQVDKIVASTRDAGLYLVMTIGNGANNGNYNGQYAKDFWSLYASRYANETHVIFEVHNEPVAWGPPYSDSGATPTGAVDMEIAVYNIIRSKAPDTPILLFSYAVFGGEGGTTSALRDIEAFNSAVFGQTNAVWTNEAVGFHGYAGTEGTVTAVTGLLNAGYPCFMTEFGGGVWGTELGGFNAEHTSELERIGVSWLTFQYVPPTGVSDDITDPVRYSERIENSGLSWKPDYGNWPVARGVYGNGGWPRKTSETWVNNFLTGATHIEAEDFDWGGEGISYSDSEMENRSGQYRTDEAVDIEATSDTNGGYNISWTADGEWMEYTIWIQNGGYYDLSLRVAGISTGRVQVIFNTQDKTGIWELPNTGGWQTWTTVTKRVYLEYGLQKLRINLLSGGFNLNWIEFSPTTTGTVADGTYKFLNRSNTAVLQGLSSDSNVTIGNYAGSTDQQWKIQHVGSGQYRINAVSNGRNWNWWMGKLGLVGWWGPGGNQCFIIKPASDGYYRLIPAGSGTSFQISPSDQNKIEEKVYSGNARQQWGILSPSAPAFPTGLDANFNSSGQGATLSWNSMSGANSYNIKRSSVSSGPYTTVASGITTNNFTDSGVPIDTIYYYVVSAVINGSETLNSAEAALHFPKLTGTIIGTEGSWNNSGNTILKAFDGDLSTYFDGPTGNGCWAGVDFGSDVKNAIKQISYCPRSNAAQRMVGGIFQGANQADFSDAVTLHTITTSPATGGFTSVNITGNTAFRYVRYLSSNNSFGNIAELEFYGYPSQESGNPGDVNGNGVVDIVDALMVAQYYVGLNPAGFIEANADVNCNGVIDIVDALQIAQYYVGLINSFC